MTQEFRMTKLASAFVIRALSFLRPSSFVIRHSDHGRHCLTSETELPRAALPARDPQRPGHHHAAFQKHAARPDKSDDAVPGRKMGQPFAGALSRRTRAR